MAGAENSVDRALKFRYDACWIWRFRIQKARILASKGRASDAVMLLTERLPSCSSDTGVEVLRLTILGAAYRIIQRFPDAEQAIKAAESLASSSQRDLMPKVLVEKGSLRIDQGDFASADTSYRRALDLSKAQGNEDQQTAATVNLARLAMSQGHLDDAVSQNADALQLSRSLRKQTFEATALGNLGWSYFELGDFENSFRFYTDAVNLSESTGLAAYRLYWFTGVANSDLATRNYAAAQSLATSTLASAEAIRNQQTIDECLNVLTQVALRTGDLKAASTLNQRAQSTRDRFAKLDALQLGADIAFAQTQFDQSERFYREVLAFPNVDPPPVWRAKSGIAAIRDAENKAGEAESLYKEAIEAIEKARTAIGHEELRLSFLSTGIAVYSDYIDFLIRHDRPEDALLQADLSRARTLAEGLSAKAIAKSKTRSASALRPQQLAQRLHATLLVYWLGEKQSYLWAVTPTKTECLKLPPAAEIDSLIKTYRDATLKSSDLLATAPETGKKLHGILVEPAQKLIPANSRVFIFPDGSLNGLNFETLIVPQPTRHFWIEDATITTGNSLSMLGAALNRPRSANRNLLLVGDAIPVPEFGELPQAKDEIRKIGLRFPGKRQTVLQRDQATRDAYLASHPDRYAYLHFVTHGTASRARPLESAVILSKQMRTDIYKLYARDIVTHPLKAELVTISACNGSGTRAYSGEGLVGLSWAFLRAGAHNVIGALWEVSDVTTPQLMDKMYAELAAGKDPATALRTAKLSLLHQHNVYAKPFYWAPFQLYSGS